MGLGTLQEVLMLLVHGPHFEEQNNKEPAEEYFYDELEFGPNCDAFLY